jgi:hypothetical protein
LWGRGRAPVGGGEDGGEEGDGGDGARVVRAVLRGGLASTVATAPYVEVRIRIFLGFVTGGCRGGRRRVRWRGEALNGAGGGGAIKERRTELVRRKKCGVTRSPYRWVTQ